MNDIINWNNKVPGDYTGTVEFYLEEYISENKSVCNTIKKWWEEKYKVKVEGLCLILDTEEKSLMGYALGNFAEELWRGFKK